MKDEQRIKLHETEEINAAEAAREARRQRLMGHIPDPHSGLPNRQLTLSERLALIREQNEAAES